MADNIKIVGSILNTTQVSRYTADDLRLIPTQKIKKNFGAPNDYIEYFVYDIGDTLLETNYTYNEYKLPKDIALNPGITPNLNINNSTATGAEVGITSNLSTTSSTYPIIEIDPVMDLENLGYSSGEFKVQYNIFKNKISSFPSASLFIKEISPDRTEVRAGSVVLTNDQIESGSLALIEAYTTASIFDPFLLNFGNNVQELVTNIVLNKVDTGYEILFKLYNELDDVIDEKTSFWVVEEISTPYVFDINLDAILSAPEGKKLRGPNFRNRGQNRKNTNTTTTTYQNLDELGLNNDSLLNQSISQSIDININYNDAGGDNGGFSNFITFGSALSRIQNFFTKIQQIETGSYFINYYTPYVSTTSSLQSEINLYSSSINDIITNFDGFENYLYFESGSLTSSFQYGITPYPKSGSNKPYTLYPSTSSQAIIWYNSITSGSEDYDSNNINYFKYSVPSYVVDDPANENYLVFLNMMGQYFDNIWIYIKSITDINLANNNLNVGISKDVVYDLLQSLGISVFNSFGDNSILHYLVGSSGSITFNENFTLGNIPSTLSISSASLSPLLNPTGSFIVNGTILNITGSISSSIYSGPLNTPTTIYIPTGSTFNDTLNNIVASFNISSSFTSYSSSLQYITAQNSSSNLNFTTSFNLDGNLANTYYAVSGSTTLYFSGGTGSFLNTIPKKDLLAESYKRIYHNLPLLLQRKGTVAGLRTLLSTFGISNQDYYTIYDTNNSASYWYTPTGSALTSSVLNIKEFGGSTTEGLLAGYNNDKVRLIDNVTASISGTFGNVLSPYSSVMQYTTASSNFRTVDDNYVDISFSPQTQIDTYASESIASVNNNWSIDDYIGNPQQLYSGSYADLDAQRKIYFVDGTGSYSGFTSSLMDYNGFIRLIQFFDNSLFKMLEDYVPARTSLSTGVTINSPVLERNKWSYARINNTTNEIEKDGSIAAPTLSSVYDNYYYNLSGSKLGYIDGVIPGTEIDIYKNYFESNLNPWIRGLQYTSSNAFTPQVSSSNPFPIFGYQTVYYSNLTDTFTSDVTASFVASPATLSLSIADLTPFLSPTGSFDVNGITIAVTGSTLPTNTATIIYVSTGSTFDNSVRNISSSFNYSKSLAPYSSSIQYISAYNDFSNLNFTTSLAVSASVANTYYIISGSTTRYFAGASNHPSTQSFSVNGISFLVTSSIFPNTSDVIYVQTGSTSIGTLSNITTALNYSRSLAPYSSSIQNISSSVLASGISIVISPYGVLPGSSLPKMPDYNDFIRSDFNILLNNVSRSLASTSRQKLEISGSNQMLGSGSYVLLLTASLQDSYLSLDSYNLPRYDGVKISSLKYNSFTSASATYIGDKSYGKTATIDHYVRKIGLFTQIVSSSFFPNRNLTSLKYLVDESGSLTELSQTPINGIDSHWAELQNTFKLGKAPTVALFDNQQFNSQKRTDGVKTIFDSGYSYYPILYYSGSNDPKLYFQYVGKGSGILMQADNIGIFITGSTSNYYTASILGGTGSIYGAFDSTDGSNGNNYYYNAKRPSPYSTITFPTYSIVQNANMAFSANFGVNINFPSASSSVTYKFDFFYNPTGTTTSSSIGSQTQTFTTTPSSLAGSLNFLVTSSFRDYVPGDQITFQLRQYGSSPNLTASLASTGKGTIYTGLKNSLAPSQINPFSTTGSGQFISGSNGVDTLILNQSLSSFIDYQYLPATSSVSLHNDYKNVDFTFSPKVGDVIFLYYNNNTQYQELNINSVTPGTQYTLTVSPNLVTNLALGTYQTTTVSKVVLVSKVPDETNVNLIFDKDDGQTSYGFLIPDNLSPDVLKNIDTITRQVKTKILSTNSGITINTV